MGLITRERVARLSGFASTQVLVQGIGFVAGIVLVRTLDPAQYGLYTLAISMVSLATILADLGLATAVLSIGGPIAAVPGALAPLVRNALNIHRHLITVGALAVVPCCFALLLKQHASAWQASVLTLLVLGTAACSVPTGIGVGVARLLGRMRLQLSLDVAGNLARLIVLALASVTFLDATIALLVNFAVALVVAVRLRRALAPALAESPAADEPSAPHGPALRRQLARLAPNSVYYIVSSQLSIWLIGIFGDAQRVAQVGALGRLGAVFVVIGSVSAALLFPYFARNDEPADLASAFVGVNTFYAALLLSLVSIAGAFPQALLWILGSSYASLGDELVWMVAATTLAAWSGTVYSIGCARGWVMPVGLVGAVGVGATIAAAMVVDVSSVRGSFMINAAGGAAGTLAAVLYFARQLQRHGRLKVALR